MNTHWLDRKPSPTPEHQIADAVRNALRCWHNPASAKAFAKKAFRIARETGRLS